MSRVLAVVVATVVTCVAAVLAVALATGSPAPGGGRSTQRPVPVASEPEVVPGPGQTFVTGTAVTIEATAAQGGSVASPFVLEATPGSGSGAAIEGALVEGVRTSIVWGGGTPLPVSGTGGIDVAGVGLRLDADGLTWRLNPGEARSFDPGSYRIAAPVAVGRSGLATPRDGVSFTADAGTTLEVLAPLELNRPVAASSFTGPGGVEIAGTLTVRTEDGGGPARVVTLEEGPYRLDLRPGPGGLDVDAVLEGTVTYR
ncbi:MAG: hypothetical protein ACT4OS_05415 [Acidimicrobiales bacterium]